MIPPTLSLEQATDRNWDALVIGAGPAGSMAARELARRGRSVLLVDRAVFPRWKVCGACLSGRTLATLAAVGLARLADQHGAVPLERFHLAAQGRRAQIPLIQGAALSRTVFDAALVQAAIAAGAEFLPETAAHIEIVDPTVRRVRLRHGDREVIASARAVVAATGLGGRLVMGHADLDRRTAPGSRIGAGTVATARASFYQSGTIYMACASGGYVGLVRLEDGQLEIAAALDPDWVRRMGGLGLAAAAAIAEAGFPAVPEIMNSHWRGTPPLTRGVSQVAGERIFLIGDAAGYVEPFTGEGIAWALSSAVAVAPLVVEAAVRWAPSLAASWARLHYDTVVSRQRLCRTAAFILRRPALTRAVIELLAWAPWAARPVVRRLQTTIPVAGGSAA